MPKNKFKKILLLFIPLVILLNISCNEEDTSSPDTNNTPTDAPSYFDPEYDYMKGYDIFPSGNNYVTDAFDEANTEFFEESSDTDLTAFNIRSKRHLYSYISSYAECVEDYDGLCETQLISDGDSTYSSVKFQNKSYLLAIKDYDVKPQPTTLGITVAPGVKEVTFSVIFVENIRNTFNSSTYKDQDFVEAAVVHELGHMRANLTHLCANSSFRNSEDHSDFACIMSKTLPEAICGYDVMTNGLHFCDKCKTKLKNINWDD